MRILVAIDSSPFADEVVDEIAKRAWSDDTTFKLISVVEPAGSWDATQQYIHQIRIILDERVKSLRLALSGKAQILDELIEGAATESILAEARNWHADLIMLGSHGDTGARRDALGSVAAAIVNEAPCSVEVVKLHSKSLQKS